MQQLGQQRNLARQPMLTTAAVLSAAAWCLADVLPNALQHRFLGVLGPGQELYVGYPSSDAVTKHLADSLTGSGSVVRNDVKVRLVTPAGAWHSSSNGTHPCVYRCCVCVQ